jgi:chromate transporter
MDHQPTTPRRRRGRPDHTRTAVHDGHLHRLASRRCRGAAVATLGIFLPSFALVALLGRIVPWLRSRPTAKAFLAGVTAASLGLMAGVLAQLAHTAITDVVTVVVAVTALALLIRTNLNSAWLVGAGLAIGLAHLLVT